MLNKKSCLALADPPTCITESFLVSSAHNHAFRSRTNLSNDTSATLLLPTLSGCLSSRYHHRDVLLLHVFFLSAPSLIPFSPPSPSLLFCLPSPFPFLPLSPLLGEGLSSSRLSLHKPGAASSVSNLSQRRESRVSVLLNHLLPSSSSNSGPSPDPSPLSTPQSTPSTFRRSSPSPPRAHGAGLGPQGIPEVVVSPPEDDDPPNSTEEEAASPQLSRRASLASQGLELLPLEGKYLCSLACQCESRLEQRTLALAWKLCSLLTQPSNPAAISSITHSKADLLRCFFHRIYPQSFWDYSLLCLMIRLSSQFLSIPLTHSFLLIQYLFLVLFLTFNTFSFSTSLLFPYTFLSHSSASMPCLTHPSSHLLNFVCMASFHMFFVCFSPILHYGSWIFLAQSTSSHS